MRQRFPVTLAAGGRWPNASGGGVSLPPFNWFLVDNKGSGDVDVSLNPNPTAGDTTGNLCTVKAGKVRVKNVGGPVRPGDDHPDSGDGWPSELHLVSASGTTVLIEIADHPIVDLVSAT